MKIRCLQDCNGLGYENFKKGQEREIPEALAKTLIEFRYAERLEEDKDPKREALIKQFKELNLIGDTEKMDTEIIEDCIKTYLKVLEREKLEAEEKAKLEAGATGGIVNDTGALIGEAGTETLIPNTETEEEKRARLIAKAKELGIKGVLENFKDETLEKKIAEAEANL